MIHIMMHMTQADDAQEAYRLAAQASILTYPETSDFIGFYIFDGFSGSCHFFRTPSSAVHVDLSSFSKVAVVLLAGSESGAKGCGRTAFLGACKLEVGQVRFAHADSGRVAVKICQVCSQDFSSMQKLISGSFTAVVGVAFSKAIDEVRGQKFHWLTSPLSPPTHFAYLCMQ